MNMTQFLRDNLQMALKELDNTTAAEGSEDGIGCAENAIRRALDALATQAAEPPQINAYQRAVDEGLIIAHLGTAEDDDDRETATRKLGQLLDWHVAVAIDPAVNGGFKLVPSEQPDDMVGGVEEKFMAVFNCEAEGNTGTRLYMDDKPNVKAALQATPLYAAIEQPVQTKQEKVVDFVHIANIAQEATGRSIWPSTVKAVLEAAHKGEKG